MADAQKIYYDSICALLRLEMERRKSCDNRSTEINISTDPMLAACVADASPPRHPVSKKILYSIVSDKPYQKLSSYTLEGTSISVHIIRSKTCDIDSDSIFFTIATVVNVLIRCRFSDCRLHINLLFPLPKETIFLSSKKGPPFLCLAHSSTPKFNYNISSGFSRLRKHP